MTNRGMGYSPSHPFLEDPLHQGGPLLNLKLSGRCICPENMWRRLPGPARRNPTCQQHMAGLTYEERYVRLFGILWRQWPMLGAKECRTLWDLPDFHSLQIAPASQQELTRARKRLTSTNSHRLWRVGKPHVLSQLSLMRRAGWVCSVVPWLALGKCPACFCLRNWKGLSPGQSLGGRKKPTPCHQYPPMSTTGGSEG